jgi:hypothetical protein
MLIRTIVVVAPLLLLGAAQGEPSDSSKKQEEQQPSVSGKGQPVPGQGQSPGAHGGGPAGPGAGTHAGSAGGQEDQTAAGEKGDTTSGAKGGRWDESGGKTADRSGPSRSPEANDGGAHGHAQDKTLSGKLSHVSDDSVTIESAKGEKHELKVAPQTRFTLSGKDVKPGELSEGQEVRASYMEQGGDRIAVRIQAAGGDAEPHREKTHNPRNNPEAEEKK